jgi:glucokinase
MHSASQHNADQPPIRPASSHSSSIAAGTRARSALHAPFLAADVGGTHARLGLVQLEAGASGAGNTLTVLHYGKFACANYACLADILREFLHGIDAPPVAQACIACAGYALGDNLLNANLPWPVSISAIRRDLGFERVALVNDFQAVAYATHFYGAENSLMIGGDAASGGNQPRLVVGPGTGLGAAVLIPGEPRPSILATEAGHAALSPRTALELQIVRRLGNGIAHVPNEQVLSGPGLVTLYRVLCEIRASAVRFDTPAQITAAALAASDAVAGECVDVFCAWLGSLVGDLVLLFGAHGGVYLAGGVLPQIVPLLKRSAFSERLCNKGALREVLERVPVRLIDHGQLGVTGAAHWFLDNEYEAERSRHSVQAGAE